MYILYRSNSIMISSSSLLSSSSSSVSPLHILRGLYRSLKSPPNLETMIVVGKSSATPISTPINKHIKSRSNPTTSHLMQMYREQMIQNKQHIEQMKNDNNTQNQKQQHEVLLLQSIAMNTLRLRTDMMERIKLQSLDAGVEEVLTPKEMSRRAAARAGLYMPESDYKDTDKPLEK